MSLISIPNTFTVGATIIASQHNSNFSVIYSDYNGNIDNTNIVANAAIADTKLAQIMTAGKVSGASFTSINSTPSGAGALPVVNGGSGADFSGSAQGTIPYYSSAGVQSVLAVGTAGQVLKTGGAAANPAWANGMASVLDYGTSASASSSKQSTALRIAYGKQNLAANTTVNITNLPFSSGTSYQIFASFSTNRTDLADTCCAVQIDGGSATIVNGDNGTTLDISWFAIGT